VRCRLQGDIRPGDEVELLIRPESLVLLTAPPPSPENVWPAAVERIVFLGEVQDISVRLREQSLRVRVPPWVELRVGQPVYLEMAPQRCTAIRVE
jgi:ABC-type Fe3+/spermidine/putrescine transport system ATPase subunit